MSNLFKKALGAFVEFEEKEGSKPEAGQEPAAAAAQAPVELPDAPADLSQDEDVRRVREAIKLLSTLPLGDIPVEKARALIVQTLKFAGMEPEELLASFHRARQLYQAVVSGEEQQIETRRQVNQERLRTLEEAIRLEKEQCEAEVKARTQRIEGARSELAEVEKAMAFFTPAQ